MSSKAYENPLIPNRRLREMYLAMVHLRLMGKHLAGRARPSIPAGLEALWTATAIGLRDHTGDLISEPGIGPAFDAILGATPKAILRQTPSPARMRSVGTPAERLTLALGASLALAATNNKNALIAFVDQADLKKSQWKTLLTAALATEAPIVFVVLPNPKATFDVAAFSQANGVPGISVDAADAIAIYRVAQESLVRARAAGGPALIAGVTFSPTGRGRKQTDPIALLASQMLSRKAARQLWLSAAETRLRAMLARF